MTFSELSDDEIHDIELYLHDYHGYHIENELTLNSIWPYIPRVLDKISSNLEYYLCELESGRSLDAEDKI